MVFVISFGFSLVLVYFCMVSSQESARMVEAALGSADGMFFIILLCILVWVWCCGYK